MLLQIIRHLITRFLLDTLISHHVLRPRGVGHHNRFKIDEPDAGVSAKNHTHIDRVIMTTSV